jgi:hypothetical protein
LKLKYKSYERNKKKKITQKKEPTNMGQLDHFCPSRPSNGSIQAGRLRQTLFDACSVGYEPTRMCYIVNPVSWASPCSFISSLVTSLRIPAKRELRATTFFKLSPYMLRFNFNKFEFEQISNRTDFKFAQIRI